MGQLVDIELNKKLFKNVDEAALTSTYGALENCFVTEANGLSRFPGLIERVNFGGNSDIYMSRHNNDLLAVGADGQTYRVNDLWDYETVEGPHVLGGDRASFARTREGTMMAAGRQIIKYDGQKNTVLSNDAPLSSFIGYLDGYVLAVERGSGLFFHSDLSDFSSWPALNVFGVDESPDDISSMLITPFNEILLAGEESIEQYERYPGGTVPFFRRWAIGDGLSEPWTFCFADNATWGLNTRKEFVRMSGQTSQSVSDDIQKEIEERYSFAHLSSLDRAWAAPIYIKGQKFIVFQSPEAQNDYGTKGFTGLFDIRRGQWSTLYGWDADNGVPDLWPGVSVYQMFDKTLVGGKGKIYELDNSTYTNDGAVQRVYCRTAHFDTLGTIQIDRVFLTLKRGVGSYTQNPKIMFRSRADGRPWGITQMRTLGYRGESEFLVEIGAQGIGTQWQFEIIMTDGFPFELRRFQVEVNKVAR